MRVALQRLLDGPCHHMSAIPGHPFDLGPDWDRALAGETVDWPRVFDGYVAAVDWPASLFWREIAEAFPEAIVLFSQRDVQAWSESAEATILPVARMSRAPDWTDGRALVQLFERFTGTSDWDHPDVLKAAAMRHDAEVLACAPTDRLLCWRASEGWAPICAALGTTVPEDPFPWVNKREDWG